MVQQGDNRGEQVGYYDLRRGWGLEYIQVKFVYQGHRVKVTGAKKSQCVTKYTHSPAVAFDSNESLCCKLIFLIKAFIDIRLRSGIATHRYMPTTTKRDVIHKTGSRPTATSPEEDRATATGDLQKKSS